jgi:HEAT repeat protein
MQPGVAFSLLLVALAAEQGNSRNKGQPMTAAQFDPLFRAKNPDVVELAKAAGPAAVPYIEPHLRDADYVVRLLAVNAVSAACGGQSPPLLIRAIGDANEQVRDNAVNGLHECLPTGQQDALLTAWDTNQTRDGYVRQQIPMVLGRLRDIAVVAELRARLPRDTRQQVKDGIIAGMAKLGDPSARNTLGEMLRDARDTRTAEVMQLVSYEDEPWVIPLLVPVLQRRGIAVRINTHIIVIERRECDLAVDEVIRISKAPFTFTVDTAAQYTDAQILEVLRYAEAQPK